MVSTTSADVATSTMSYPIVLRSITPREAVVDALYRVVIGLDVKDRKLFDSAFIDGPERRVEMNGKVFSGTDEVMANVFDRVWPLVTQHSITNVRLDLEDGADSAYVTAYALAYHFRPQQGMNPASEKVLSGCLYHVDVVEDGKEGVWKVKNWAVKLLWVEGDMSILQGPQG